MTELYASTIRHKPPIESLRTATSADGPTFVQNGNIPRYKNRNPLTVTVSQQSPHLTMSVKHGSECAVIPMFHTGEFRVQAGFRIRLTLTVPVRGRIYSAVFGAKVSPDASRMDTRAFRDHVQYCLHTFPHLSVMILTTVTG